MIIFLKLFGGVAAVSIVYYIYLIIKNKDVVKFAWNGKGIWLPLFPFIGNIYFFLFTKGKINVHTGIELLTKYCGFPTGFWFGSIYHYVTNDAEESRFFLNSTKFLDKGGIYQQIQAIFPSTLLLVEGEKWKPRRRYFKSAYKSTAVQSLIPTFQDLSSTIAERVKAHTSSRCLYDLFNRYSFANFFYATFNHNTKVDPALVDELGGKVDYLQAEFAKLMLNPLIPANIWLKLPMGSQLNKGLEEFRPFILNAIALEKKTKEEEAEYAEDVSLVDLLIADDFQKKLESDVFAEVCMFAAGATDTTGHTLTFCTTLLGMHQDVQRKLYEEIIFVVGDGEVDWNIAKEMKYTEMVLNETLRLFPPIPFIARHCSEDADLGDGRIFPKGASVGISIFHIQRSPKYWTDPNKFDPERFSAENIKNIVSGSYFPFSMGSRNCIGQAFANTLIKVTLAKLVKDFQIFSDHKSIDEFVLESVISMRTVHPLSCSFVSRNESL